MKSHILSLHAPYNISLRCLLFPVFEISGEYLPGTLRHPPLLLKGSPDKVSEKGMGFGGL